MGSLTLPDGVLGRRTAAGIRLLAAAMIVVAVVGQLRLSLSLDPPDDTAFLVNFFSFFTIQSNAVAAVVCLVGAVLLWARPADPAWFRVCFAAAVTYMATTGIVYNVLLRDVSLDQEATLDWSNEILHVVGPIYLVLAWLVAPGRGRMTWGHLWILAVFPLVWAAYTMVRGALTGWYPYPFLDPSQPGGYGTVVLYILGIAVLIMGLGSGVVWTSRRRMPWQRAA